MGKAAIYLDKRTADDRLFDVDCQDLLDVDEIIMSATGSVDGAPPPNSGQQVITLGDCIVNPAPITYPKLGKTAPIGQALQVRISGGVIPDGATSLSVTLRFLLLTNINPDGIEATVILRLINKP
jgi:hypothetical protein